MEPPKIFGAVYREEIVVIATGHMTEDHTHIVGEDGNEGELFHDDE